MFGLGVQELVIIGVVAVLLFGKRLPEVARSLGGSYREFKKGLVDMQSSFNVSDSYSPPSRSYAAKSSTSTRRSYDDIDDHDEATAPKFEPPPSEPKSVV